MTRWIATSLVSLMIAPLGCTSKSEPTAHVATPMKEAPATPLAEKKNELGSDNAWTPAWDAFIETRLPPELLSARAAKAVASYCPAFASEGEADKRAFWAYTLQAIAAAEAGLKPTADVHHTQAAVARIDTVTHRPIRQQGLMQLTYEDATRYNCDFNWQADSSLNETDPNRTILQPERNLACGINILKNQIIDQGKPLLSRTSYWSTLQPGTQSYRVFAKQMANVPKACGIGAARPQRPANRAKHTQAN
jgi:hypothetical protein